MELNTIALFANDGTLGMVLKLEENIVRPVIYQADFAQAPAVRDVLNLKVCTMLREIEDDDYDRRFVLCPIRLGEPGYLQALCEECRRRGFKAEIILTEHEVLLSRLDLVPLSQRAAVRREILSWNKTEVQIIEKIAEGHREYAKKIAKKDVLLTQAIEEKIKRLQDLIS